MVVLKVGAVKYPHVLTSWISLSDLREMVGLKQRDVRWHLFAFSHADLDNGDAGSALALTEEVVASAVDRFAQVRSTSVALANEALPHFFVLVYFVAAFGEADSGQTI